MKLEQTIDYARFITNYEQRSIDERHAKRIAENIAHVGFLPSKPIQCYKKGGKLMVVDGHHRLEAAKAAKSPVFYVVESDRCQQTMAAENFLVKKWTQEDYIRLYASRGIEDYKLLLQYKDIGIPVGMAASMMIYNAASSGNANAAVQNGTFKIKTTWLVDKVAELIQEFGEVNPAAKSRPFIAAISKCIMCEGFSCDTFIRRMRENPLMLEKTSNEEQMLMQIESVYNFRSRNPFPVKFEAEKAAKERNALNLKNVKKK